MQHFHSNRVLPSLSKFRLLPVVLLLSAALVLAGCATGGQPGPGALADQIKPGMTKAQVVSIAGEPSSRMTGMSPGFGLLYGGAANNIHEVWSYSDMGLNLIPFVGIIRGGRTNTTSVQFNKEGRVVNVSTSSTGMW